MSLHEIWILDWVCLFVCLFDWANVILEILKPMCVFVWECVCLFVCLCDSMHAICAYAHVICMKSNSRCPINIQIFACGFPSSVVFRSTPNRLVAMWMSLHRDGSHLSLISTGSLGCLVCLFFASLIGRQHTIQSCLIPWALFTRSEFPLQGE